MKSERLVQSILTITVILCAIGIYLTGCGEETENPIGAEGAPGTVGTLKVPDTAPGAPNLVIPEGTPTVTSVGCYHDWQLTKPLTGTVAAGKTIFIKVDFSENMKVVVADDKHARPILYYRIGGELTRFKIADFGAKGEDFVSGDAKPMQTKASFICKYQVQPEDRGEFVFAVGKWSIDLEGHTLPAFYTHKEQLWLGKPLSPTVTSVDCYSNWQLTKPVSGTVTPGTTVYTKIVFSEEMEHVVSNGAKARPELYYRIGDRDVRHNIVPYKANGRHFAHGDTKPLNKQGVYVGKYKVKSTDFGSFTLVVGTESANKKGVKLPEEYVHAEALHIPDPPPPTVTLTGMPTGIDNTDTVSVAVRGKGVTHYQYSVNAGETCGDYGNSTPIHRRLTVDVSDLPDGMVTLCVLGKNLAGIWQTKPTTVQWTRDTSVVPALLDPVVTDNTEAVPVTPGAQDFSGFVYTPKPVSTGFYTRSSVSPVSGATVTALSGSVSGQTVTTSQNGHYVFRNVAESSLLLRVEKSGFEPKEVEAHRFRPTTLSSGVRANFAGDPQNTPGNILIGHQWTSDIRPVLNKMTVVHDLLYVDARGAPNRPQWFGGYRNGVVFVYLAQNDTALQMALVHEVLHAHQHALVSVDGSGGDTSSWKNTPEGRAFAAARARDWQQVGKRGFDTRPDTIVLRENAATFYSLYWLDFIGRESAPHRFAWADTWLPK